MVNCDDGVGCTNGARAGDGGDCANVGRGDDGGDCTSIIVLVGMTVK